MSTVAEQMDLAAGDAEKDLEGIPEEELKKVGDWVQKWYMSAGYKRLAKILRQYAGR